ncbi:SAV_6107 family HEPN domain-containing protein [Timonella senegalensis]|uniref:SAV_6107 family HEPN domain-containing protein n=1 Tax=Timonella senegalensis TaxID=1465825 RepID=UPI002FDEB3C7
MSTQSIVRNVLAVPGMEARVDARPVAAMAATSALGRTDVSAYELVPNAVKYIKSADTQLGLALTASDGFDRFSHAHFAALRLAGAVVESVVGAKRVRRVEGFWERFARVAPELALWAVIFEEGAQVRAAMESGRLDTISRSDSEYWLNQTREFRVKVLQSFGIDPLTNFSLSYDRVA